jgi:hypothetical protein
MEILKVSRYEGPTPAQFSSFWLEWGKPRLRRDFQSYVVMRVKAEWTAHSVFAPDPDSRALREQMGRGALILVFVFRRATARIFKQTSATKI